MKFTKEIRYNPITHKFDYILQGLVVGHGNTYVEGELFLMSLKTVVFKNGLEGVIIKSKPIWDNDHLEIDYLLFTVLMMDGRTVNVPGYLVVDGMIQEKGE